MMKAKLEKFTAAAALGSLLLFAAASASAQGNSQGKGKGAGKGGVQKVEKGKQDDRGKSGKGGYDDRYDDDRGPGAGKGKKMTSPRFNGLAKKIGMSPERARDWYELERKLNPDLTYGQFVAVNMIARKQGGRYPGLTAEAMFRRMRDGMSIGQAAKDLGLRGRDHDRERDRITGIFGDYEKDRIPDRDRDRYRGKRTIGEIVDDYIYSIGW